MDFAAQNSVPMHGPCPSLPADCWGTLDVSPRPFFEQRRDLIFVFHDRLFGELSGSLEGRIDVVVVRPDSLKIWIAPGGPEGNPAFPALRCGLS